MLSEPSQSPALRVGFIGAGFIAQVAHLATLSNDPRTVIAGIADPRPKLRDAVARQFGALSVPHHDDLLNNPDIDAVVICVFRRCQAALALAALKGGKAVFSEKPMAYSSKEGAHAVKQAQRSGKPYMVGFMKRFDAGVRAFQAQLAQIRESGELGDILHVMVRDFCPTYGVTVPPHQRADGPTLYRYTVSPPGPANLPSEYEADFDYSLNVLSHNINLLRFLFGDIFTAERLAVRSGRAQSAHLASPRFDVAISMGLSDGGQWDQEIEVLFRKGRMRLTLPSPLDRQGIATCEIRHAAKSTQIRNSGGEAWAFQAQMAHFVSACKGEISLDTSGKDGLIDLQIIESLWERAVWNP